MNFRSVYKIAIVIVLLMSSVSLLAQVTNVIEHTVGRGETLMSIARMYNVDVKEILEANERKDEKIYAGETIYIPNKKGKFHTIKAGETLYRLSVNYNVSIESICALNPGLSTENFKTGMVIMIPTDASSSQRIDNNRTIETKKENYFNKNINVALILPFTKPGKEQTRLAEFYEGMLIGLYDLKMKKVSVNFNVYDSYVTSISKILSLKEMEDMNLIIGPFNPGDIKPISDFSKKHKIPLVVPFTSKNDEIFNNPYLFQINTPQSYLYSEVYLKFLDKFKNYNIVFVNENGNTDKLSFIDGLKYELRTSDVVYKEVYMKNIVQDLPKYMSQDKKNIIVPNSGEHSTLSVLLPVLQNIVRNGDNVGSIHLFGYPEWQTYTQDYLSAFYEVDTYFYSSFYANNLSSESVEYYNKFKKWYKKDMANTYPKYGMLGYDLISYFVPYLWNFGDDFYKNINTLNFVPVQTGLRFERVNNWGGFLNKNVFFIHFSRDFGLNKIDFD